MSANLLHFGINFLLTLALSFMMPQDTVVGFTVGLSVGKEVGDYMNYGEQVGNKQFAKMAANDLFYDSLGIAAGLAVKEFWEDNR